MSLRGIYPKRIYRKRKISMMILLILILQIVFPVFNIVVENIMTITSVALGEEEAIDDNGISWLYTLNENDATNIKPKDNTNLPEEVIIPSVLDGHTVTSIGNNALMGCGKVKKITIPEGIISIGNNAFYSNGIKDITLPNSLKSIGNSAFGYCQSLETINIPQNVTFIGTGAFNYCKSLREITIPNNVENIYSKTFENCTNLSNITISEGVKKIESDAFRNCISLIEINIPKTVTYINMHRENTSLYERNPFFSCSNLTKINIDNENQNYCSENGIMFNKNKTELLFYPIKNENINYTIPNSVTSICEFAFCYSNIENVEIPETVVNIGEGAFDFCEKLLEINISKNITNLNDSTPFYGCLSLNNINVSEDNPSYSSENGVLFNKTKTELIRYPIGNERTEYTIPNSVSAIKERAFENGGKLITINMPESVRTIEEYNFRQCTNLVNINIPSKVTKIEDATFSKCSSLESIIIPKKVTEIGSSAFSGCTNITNIQIPDSVTTIGNYTFMGCDKLEYLTIPESVTSIGSFSNTQFGQEKVIYKCKNGSYAQQYALENNIPYIDIDNPENITKVNEWNISKTSNDNIVATIYSNGLLEINGTGEMKDWTSAYSVEWYNKRSLLRNVEIKEGITSIGKHAFEYCRGIKNVDISNSITKINENAFSDCYNITSIVIPNNVQIINPKTFEKCHNLEEINISSNVKEIGLSAFLNCDSLSRVNIDEGLETIGLYAFKGCAKLKEISLPTSIKKVNNYAFDEGVETVYYPSFIRTVIKEYSGTFENFVEVVLSKIDRIEITKEPGKINYYEGENFSKSGMVVTAFYEDGTSRVVTDYTITDGDNLKSEKTSVTIAYEEGGITKTTEQKITVFKELERLEITTPPTRTEYIEGQDFDRTGMTVTVFYKDGTSKEVTNYTISNGGKLRTNDTYITLYYLENLKSVTATQEITVLKKEISRIEITTPPTKTNYVAGQSFNKTGMVVTAYYNDETSEEITNYIVVDGNNLKEGTETVTIVFVYGEKTETALQNITVREKLDIDTKASDISEVDGKTCIESINPLIKVKDILNIIETNGTIEIYKGTKKITNENENLGTGMKLKIYLDSEQIEYTLVVLGDLDGDGEFGDIDLLKLARYQVGLDNSLKGEYLHAANVYKDDNYGDDIDLLKMARILVGLDSINDN